MKSPMMMELKVKLGEEVKKDSRVQRDWRRADWAGMRKSLGEGEWREQLKEQATEQA